MARYLKEEIRVTLTGKRDLTYTINVISHPFMIRWLETLKDNVIKNRVLEKNYCFLGFADSKRNLNFLCKELNEVVDQINGFDWTKHGLAEYKIDKTFVEDDFMFPETLPIGHAVNGDESKTPGCRLKHDACNLLHRYFEDLQGQAWALSKYYIHADNNTKYAIRQLNNICHEIEGWVHAYRKSKFDKEWIRPAQITTFLHAPRIELQYEDFGLFKHNRYDRELGGVYLHWSQVGKTLYEVFRDEDGAELDDATCSAINHQQFYSGEFDVEWGKTITRRDQFKAQELSDFRNWLAKHGYSYNTTELALGYIKLGQVNLKKSFGTEDSKEIYNQLVDCLNIQKIAIVNEERTHVGREYSCEYNYTLEDPNWKQIQLKELRKGYESHTLR